MEYIIKVVSGKIALLSSISKSVNCPFRIFLSNKKMCFFGVEYLPRLKGKFSEQSCESSDDTNMVAESRLLHEMINLDGKRFINSLETTTNNDCASSSTLNGDSKMNVEVNAEATDNVKKENVQNKEYEIEANMTVRLAGRG